MERKNIVTSLFWSFLAVEGFVMSWKVVEVKIKKDKSLRWYYQTLNMVIPVKSKFINWTKHLDMRFSHSIRVKQVSCVGPSWYFVNIADRIKLSIADIEILVNDLFLLRKLYNFLMHHCKSRHGKHFSKLFSKQNKALPF